MTRYTAGTMTILYMEEKVTTPYTAMTETTLYTAATLTKELKSEQLPII